MTNYAYTVVLKNKEQCTQLATYNTFEQADDARIALCKIAAETVAYKELYVQITDMNPSVEELQNILCKLKQ